MSTLEATDQAELMIGDWKAVALCCAVYLVELLLDKDADVLGRIDEETRRDSARGCRD